ncbi:hypothetical protein KSW38_15910 [Paenarthrobacter sp. MMS21-TAE1-1]|uniref:Acetophenone carboxylase-like C-terminal domain-containing protein n=2 Tax=Paenarthrobacter aromaticivorans TaxID=2849150 RepID=A0ABS6I9L4_9MICC|nr:hypothetical protein [Paenarthrobacter sp. MMS21-TAE1-1]
MSFSKQRYTLRIPLGDRQHGWTSNGLADAFLREHAKSYDGRHPARNIKLINLRTVTTGRRSLPSLAPTQTKNTHQQSKRGINFTGEAQMVDVLSRDSLVPGQSLEGPLVIEQIDTTIILPPVTRSTVHDIGSIIVEVARSAAPTLIRSPWP